MRFQYIIGRSGVGKSHVAMAQFSTAAASVAGQEQWFYLVPDQMSFQTEWQLLQQFPNQVASNVFVYSFKNIVRLVLNAWETKNHQSLKPITDLGMQMIIRKVLLQQQASLQVYGSVIKQPGFSKHLLDCLHELDNWQVDASNLSVNETSAESLAFQQKMADLALIQREVAKQIKEQAVWSQAQQLQFASELLNDRELVKQLGLHQATIVIDGFHSFNKSEQGFLQQLAKVVKQMTLVLTLDRPVTTLAAIDESPTFAITAKTYWHMRQFTNQAFQLDEVKEIWLTPKNHTRSECVKLQQLEKWLANPDGVAKTFSPDGDGMNVVAAMNRLREVEAVAQQIRHCVINGARYHEIAVYVGQSANYYDLFRRIFPLYELPFFVDEKTPMYFHPVLEVIIGALHVCKNNWQYEDIFRSVKTGFFNREQEALASYHERLSMFEHYCVKRGKFGRRHWHEATDWQYREYDSVDHLTQPLTDKERVKSQELQEIRASIVEPLQSFEALIQGRVSVQTYSEAIFALLLQLQVPDQLAAQIQDAEAVGDVTRAKREQQVWQQLIQVFEELVAIAGEEVLELADFISLLESGFEQLKFQLAPPAIDQLLIGDFERARFQMAKGQHQMGVKHAFVLGVNEGEVPFLPSQVGLLSQADREKFASANIQLAPDLYGSIASQQLNFYMVAVSASESVTFSYVLADGDNGESEMYPARIMSQLLTQFQIQPTLYPQKLGALFGSFALNPQASYRYLHHHLQQGLQGVALPEMWQATYNWLLTHDAQAHYIKRSLTYQNRAAQITPELVKQTFGRKISGTATRIETYNRCPYRFFAQYMLHLEQPSEYEIAFLQIGNLYHHCLEMISRTLVDQNRHFSQLTRPEIIQLTQAAIAQIQPYLHYHAFYETARNRYLLEKLQQNVIVSVERLVKIDQHSAFDLRFAEVSFGQKQSHFAARHYPLNHGYQLSLRGKIDRIDTLETESGMFVRIIDYKSTDKSVDFDEIYHGLSLQMPMYLDVATHDIIPQAKAAGMFYFTIQNKKQTIKQTEISEQTGLAQQQLRGYALADPEIITKLDDTFVTGSTEYIKSIKATKTGLHKASMVLSQQELTNLTEFTNRKIVSSAQKIVDGDVPIEPTGIDALPCTYCPYRSLCQFDQQLPENPGCYASKHHKQDVLASESEEK